MTREELETALDTLIGAAVVMGANLSKDERKALDIMQALLTPEGVDAKGAIQELREEILEAFSGEEEEPEVLH